MGHSSKRSFWCLFLLPVALVQEARGNESSADSLAEEATIEDVVVIGRRISTDQAGYNSVYGKDISSIYMGKEEVGRYKGSSAADLFKGMLGVFSGDARNSGALDPNIRGIQGPGRVPLTIDGTEQAITVWRGYNGANNRNYIDPSLIGSVTVEKGPSLTRGVMTSVGGGVAIKTLGVEDVLSAEQTFGAELKVEAGNNTTRARLPTLMTGQDAKDVPGWTGVYTDPSLLLDAKTSSDNRVLSGRDQAVRLALAARQEYFDIIGAYSHRTQGNYFAGKGGAHNYRLKGDPESFDFKAYMADVYKPGSEVPNTSNEMTSYLLKARAYLPNEQSLQLGLRHSQTRYGDILPSRINLPALEAKNQGVPQWPLSEVTLAAYNLLYLWQPQDQPLLNVEANLWATRSNSDTYNGGGFPNEPYHYAFGPYVPAPTQPIGPNNPLAPIDPNRPEINSTFRNTALVNARNNRWGFSISNLSQLSPSLNLTLGGRFQHEQIYSKDIYNKTEFGDFKASPRTGKRRENEYSVDFDWRPRTWLALNAGMRHTAYSSFDEGLATVRALKAPQQAVSGRLLGYKMDYRTRESLDAYRERYDNDVAHIEDSLQYHREDAKEEGMPFEEYMVELWGDDWQGLFAVPTWAPDGRQYDQAREVFWQADANGKVHRQDNPFLNGQLDDVDYQLMGEDREGYGSYTKIEKKTAEVTDKWPEVKKQKDSGWSPVLSATLFLTENARLYARYSEAVRLPSIFESTVGFSASPGNQNARVKPEHSRNMEVAYVHDLRDWLAPERYADVKLAYYHNRIKDVIERDQDFRFTNLEAQRVSGLEFQGRYDSGRFFSDLGMALNLENKVCDEEQALLADPYHGRVATCVEGGFRTGYLRNMVQPKYSVNWLLGGRFMNDRLEVGTRVLYHRGARDTEAKNFYDTQLNADFFNQPLHWASVVVVDAHVNYKLNRHVQVELAANNLTNRYYLDPLSRSRMPAPGRTLRVSLTGKF